MRSLLYEIHLARAETRYNSDSEDPVHSYLCITGPAVIKYINNAEIDHGLTWTYETTIRYVTTNTPNQSKCETST